MASESCWPLPFLYFRLRPRRPHRLYSIRLLGKYRSERNSFPPLSFLFYGPWLLLSPLHLSPFLDVPSPCMSFPLPSVRVWPTKSSSSEIVKYCPGIVWKLNMRLFLEWVPWYSAKKCHIYSSGQKSFGKCNNVCKPNSHLYAVLTCRAGGRYLSTPIAEIFFFGVSELLLSNYCFRTDREYFITNIM